MRIAMVVVAVVALAGCEGHTVQLGGTGGGGSGNGGSTPLSCADAGSAPVVLASGLTDPEAITISSTNVYWATTFGSDGIQSVSLCGGPPVSFASGGALGVETLALGSTGVFWLTASPGRAVFENPFSGGTPTLIAASPVADFALDATNVYWTVSGGCYPPSECYQGVCCTGAIMMLPQAGGTPTTLVSNINPYALAVDAERLYWTGTTAAGSDGGDDGGVDGSDSGSGSGSGSAAGVGGAVSATTGLWSVPLAGGTSTELTTTFLDGDPQFIAAQGSSIYWLSSAGIVSVAKQGGTPAVVIPASSDLGASSGPVPFVTDAESIYWTNPGPPCPIGPCNGTVMKAPLGGGTATTLASGFEAPTGIAVDAHSVYWLVQGTGGSDGRLMKLTPK
jgi:hypothetical protein